MATRRRVASRWGKGSGPILILSLLPDPNLSGDAGLPRSWLNDGVKAFLSLRGDFDAYLELPNLRVFVAIPEYLLAMKCMAMRLGEEFQDLDDVRFLLRYLNITEAEEALEVVMRYFDEAQISPKTRFALEEILSG
jgi:hypothetical protein